MIITLDGPAGSGKSTLAKLLADKLSFYQIDSGAFYRWITHILLTSGQKSLSEEFLTYLFSQIPDVRFVKGRQHIYWNNEDMEKYIRKPEITQNIKLVADEPHIRDYVNKIIQNLAGRYSLIADGRDMGTVVFPDAEIKFFIDASLPVRAKRRFSEFQSHDPDITVEEVERQIKKRDEEDQKRKFGRLEAAKDAIFVDTTNLEINAALQSLIKAIQSKYPKI